MLFGVSKFGVDIMNKFDEIKELIERQKSRVDAKLSTIDYAKGYCFGALSMLDSDDISEDEYNELASLIDSTFDI